MNTILYADDVIVTSTDVTMRREEFEQWQTEMTQSNGNNFPRINDSDIISRSTSGNWILDSGASTHVVNVRAHRRVVQNAVAGIVSDRYIYYNARLNVNVVKVVKLKLKNKVTKKKFYFNLPRKQKANKTTG